MKLTCPECEMPIPADHINVVEMVAVCPNCDHVFNFSGMVPARKLKPRKLKPPQGIEVDEDEQALVIRRRVLSPAGADSRWAMVGNVAIAFLCGLFGLLAITMLMTDSVEALEAITLLVLLPIGLPFVYLILCALVDWRQITLDDVHLKDEYRPLPLPFGRRFRRENLVGVIAAPSQSPYSRMRQRTYDVDVRLADGSQQIFLRNLPAETAQFIAQELNRMVADDAGEVVTLDGDMLVEPDAVEPEVKHLRS